MDYYPSLSSLTKIHSVINMSSIKLYFLVIFLSISNAYLIQRDSTQICTDLRAKSNDGDRKIAVVIDSSGSMSGSDPYNLRLSAGKSVIDWLITKNEANSTQKPDMVTVINFDDVANLDYPLGDPADADSSLDGIGADGGTFIAGGVEMAIAQLTASGTGSTSDRSGIVVFTDGEVSKISSSVFYDFRNCISSNEMSLNWFHLQLPHAIIEQG
jgi:Mg-chelatase subunit ChlD